MKLRITHQSGVYMLHKKGRLVSDAAIASRFASILAEVNITEPKTSLELDASAILAIKEELLHG